MNKRFLRILRDLSCGRPVWSSEQTPVSEKPLKVLNLMQSAWGACQSNIAQAFLGRESRQVPSPRLQYMRRIRCGFGVPLLLIESGSFTSFAFAVLVNGLESSTASRPHGIVPVIKRVEFSMTWNCSSHQTHRVLNAVIKRIRARLFSPQAQHLQLQGHHLEVARTLPRRNTPRRALSESMISALTLASSVRLLFKTGALASTGATGGASAGGSREAPGALTAWSRSTFEVDLCTGRQDALKLSA